MSSASAESPGADPLAVLPEGRLQGRQVFADLVAQALVTAAAQGWSRLVLADPDFADWPLGERAVVASLQAWAARGRTLHMIAHDYRAVRERHPRFVQWRVTWSHLFEARACSGVPLGELPSALWSAVWTLERIDVAHGVQIASRLPARRVALGERLDQWWQKGSPSFPAVTLGL
jgi:hypothetical protein